jgi:Holliday junction resolvase RusA-like endonuclease
MRLTVYGAPATKGSSRAFPKRAGGVTVVPDNRPTLKRWEDEVRRAAQDEAAKGDGLLSGALFARATWWLPRPKWHTGAHGLVPSAPPYPIGKPDLDKLARAIFDPLKGVIYADDAQLVQLHLAKHYADHGTPPRLVLEITGIAE